MFLVHRSEPMKNPAKFWDKIADKYAKTPIVDEKAYQTTLERTRSYLSPKDSVLEIGCGTGSTALLLAGDVKQLTASDLSAKMVGIGAEKAHEQAISNITFINSDLFDSTLEKHAPYDTVLAFNILHLLEDLPTALKRINSMLKPGGMFISKTVCQPAKGAPFKFRMLKMILPLLQIIGKAPFVNFMTITELEETIVPEGFDILETGNYPASPPSRYIVARKT